MEKGREYDDQSGIYSLTRVSNRPGGGQPRLKNIKRGGFKRNGYWGQLGKVVKGGKRGGRRAT